MLCHSKRVSLDSLFNDAIANPTAYGFTNVTESCLLTGCSTPNTFLFWDEIHPTTAGHSILADFAFTSLQAQAVPEPPATVGLLLGGVFLFGVGKLRQRRQKSRFSLSSQASATSPIAHSTRS